MIYFFSGDDVSDNNSEESHIVEAKNALFLETVKHAVSVSKYYRELYKGILTSIRGLEDLHLLPVIKRDDVETHGEDMVWKDAPGRIFIQTTSGTSGRPLKIYRSTEERWSLNNLLEGVPSSKNQKLFLIILNTYTDTACTTEWTDIHPLHTFLFLENNFIKLKDTLHERHAIPLVEPYITGLIGSISRVYMFSVFSLQKGYDLQNTHVETICTTSDFYPPQIKAFLQETWDAAVVDSYSLTEVPAVARECETCGSYHFDNQVVWEVVDPFTRLSVKEGVGFLCLTTLYPFVQVNPLIRYNTGDLVKISENPCPKGAAFNPLGRMKNSVLLRKNGKTFLLLSTTMMREILADIPDVSREPVLFSVRLSIPLSYSFYVIYGLEVEESEEYEKVISLHIELTYDPSFYRGRVKELSESILESLLEKSPDLKHYYENNTVAIKISFYGPGALPKDVKVREKLWE